MSIDTREVQKLAADLATAPARTGVKVERAVERNTKAVERDAQHYAPVLTGELVGRITAFSRGKIGVVTSGAPYSDYVEEGTSDTAPQPFMGPALAKNEPGLVNDISRAGEDFL